MKIQFAPRREDYVPIGKTLPQPAKNFIPDWFKDMPVHKAIDDPKTALLHQLDMSTIKKCPSFRDIWKYGIVIPAPCDIYINATHDEWMWRTPTNIIELEYHADYQFKDHYPNKNIKGVFKIKHPLAVITPKGYSVMQIPLLYHNNPDWYFPWGLLDSDEYHDLNPQLIVTSKDREILIKQGEPLFYLYPFKRENWQIEMLEYKDIQQKLKETRWKLGTMFQGRYIKNIRKNI
jgi:hypothetical protein